MFLKQKLEHVRAGHEGASSVLQPSLYFSHQRWYPITDPGGMEGWVAPAHYGLENQLEAMGFEPTPFRSQMRLFSPLDQSSGHVATHPLPVIPSPLQEKTSGA